MKTIDDLISRSALMKEFSDFVRGSNNSDFARTPTWNDAVSLVGSMPSAQPMTVYIDDETKAFIDTLRESTRRWIPCTERLPEENTRVLCCTRNKKGIANIVLGYYIPESGYWACGMNSNVVAWMPLPEPYEEDEQDERHDI